jgi:hypothetical protein
MASHYDRWSDGALQLKLALVALVVGLLIWHILHPRLQALEAVVFVVSLMIVWLGVTLAH